MIDWTDGARETFDRYATRVRGRLRAAGADPEEVLFDLRQHMEQKAHARGVALLTASEVEQMLASMAELEREPEPALELKPESGPPSDPTRSVARELAIDPEQRKPLKLIRLWIGGIILPLLAILVQATTGMCTFLFEPIPTFGHAFLLTLVPAAVFAAIHELRHGPTPARPRAPLLIGMALALSSLYALLFLPLLPLSLVASFFGIGLLGLSPFTAWLSVNSLRKSLVAAGAPLETRRFIWRGFWLAVFALLVIEAAPFVTGLGLHLADSKSANNERIGLWILRHFGDEPIMRASAQRQTFEEGSRRTSLLLFPARMFDPVSSVRAREIYYRATGDTIDGKSLLTHDDWRPWTVDVSRRAFDDDQGGEKVGGALDDLALGSSRIDAHVKPEDSLAYLEWTQEFQNSGGQTRESRAQWRLPEGAVVSRVTLWVDGEPREAAFGSTAQVRRAYQEVAIRQRRDPLLVTWSGPNTVLVQAFPVMPGKSMRIRVGVTVPLSLDAKKHGHVTLPELVETNYVFGPKLRHHVWVESNAELHANVSTLRAHGSRNTTLHGSLAADELEQIEVDVGPLDLTRVRIAETKLGGVCLGQSECEAPARVAIEQRWVQTQSEGDRTLAIVIDGSRTLKPHAEAIANLLEQLNARTNARVWFAGDRVQPIAQREGRSPGDSHALASAVRAATFIGGMDDAPALEAALDWLEGKKAPELIWIHAAQGLELDSGQGLEQRIERDGASVRWTALQLAKGPHRLLQALAPRAHVTTLSGRAGLEQLANTLSGRPTWTLSRTLLKTEAAAGTALASDHLVRLWASELIARDRSLDDAQKSRLGVQRQLVTHLTGAVVLERKEQYARHELEPVDPTSVPAIPEPPLVWLLALAVLLLAGYRWRERSHA